MAVFNHSKLLYTIYFVALVCPSTTQYPAAVAEAASVTPNEIPVVSPAVRAASTMAHCIAMQIRSLHSSKKNSLQLCVPYLTAAQASPLLTDVFVPVQRASSPLELLQETTAAVRHVTRSTQTAAATGHMDLLRQPTMLALHLMSNHKVLSPFTIKLME